MPAYTCPTCSTVLTATNPVPAGKKIKCRSCQTVFAPAAEPEPAAAAPVNMKPHTEYTNDDTPFGVIKEEETEEQKKSRKRVNFAGTEAKFRKSARGPATALLVLPSNLLIAEGALTILAGLIVFAFGMWPVLFSDGIPPNDEEWADAIVIMMFGVMMIAWGVLVCGGASKMQSLESYTWAMAGAVLGMAPLLVGIFAIAMLRNPRVIAGFEEMVGAAEEGEDDGLIPNDDDDDDEDDEDEDEDEDEDDEDDEEEEEEDARAKKKRR